MGLFIQNGSLTFSFATVAGESYRVDFKDDLSSPIWTPLGGNRPGTGGLIAITDDLNASAQRFYRIVRLPKP